MIDKSFTSPEFRRKQRSTDFIESELELSILSATICSVECIEYLIANFNSEYISSERYKNIYDIIISFYEETNKLVNKKTFKNLLRIDSRKEKQYLITFKKMLKLKKKISLSEVVSGSQKLYDCYQTRVIAIGLNEMATDLKKVYEKRDLSIIPQTQKTFLTFANYIETSKIIVSTKGEMISDYEEWKKDYQNKQNDPELLRGIETGIKQIDKQMPPLQKGELGAIAGPSSGGKSILAMIFGLHNWKLYGDTCTMTIEMSKDKYQMRQYCYLSGIDYKQFTKYQLTRKQWNHLDKTIEKNKKNVNKNIIIDMPEGSSVSAVKREFELAMKHNNVTLGIIDYMNIMCGPDGKIDFGWEQQLSIAAQIKLLIARKLHLPIWSPIQTSGDGQAFSSHIKDQLDVGITLKPDEETRKTGLMKMDWFKTRDFNGEPFALETHRNVMRFTPPTKSQEKANKKINNVKPRKVTTGKEK